MLKSSNVSGRRSKKAQDGGGRRIDRVAVLDNGDREAPETISGLYIARSQSMYTLLLYAGFLTMFLCARGGGVNLLRALFLDF